MEQTQKRPGLGDVIKGRIVAPVRVLMSGTDGVGKTTFAADAPSPIFVGKESGTEEIDTNRWPEVRSWSELLHAVDTLNKESHAFKTLALDSLDWLEPLCWQYVCATKRDRAGKSHDTIEGFGFGAGYVLALDVWRDLLSRLDALRNTRKMNIILIGHTLIKTFKNPEGDDFERYQLKLHDKSAALLREWADAVLFANYETLTHQKDARAQVKGVSTGARVMHTERRAAFDAKNRYGLPDTMPLSWAAFAEAVATSRADRSVAIRESIESALSGQPDALIARVRLAVTKAGDDSAALANILNHLTVTVSQEKKAS
jgi:hypothetical protein